MPALSRITLYPIKSLDGITVNQATVLASGALEHDRRFVIADTDGLYVHGKRTPLVHTLRAEFDLETLTLRLKSKSTSEEFHIDRDRPALEKFLSEYFGLPVRLLENRAVGFPDDLDFPGPTVVSTATLVEVAGWFPGMSPDDAGKRFRTNLEIDEVEPFWEDRLYAEPGQSVKFQVGGVVFEGTNPCQRCIVPSRSATTGERIGQFSATFEARRFEALPFWATRSRFDHFYRLAVNTRVVPGGEGVIRVGEEVTILE